MILNSQEEILKAQKTQEKINDKFVQNSIKKKEQRHVKEENEPLLDDFLQNFRESYAKKVVGDSMKEVVKEIKKNV